jgi:hypothetical protein
MKYSRNYIFFYKLNEIIVTMLNKYFLIPGTIEGALSCMYSRWKILSLYCNNAIYSLGGSNSQVR